MTTPTNSDRLRERLIERAHQYVTFFWSAEAAIGALMPTIQTELNQLQAEINKLNAEKAALAKANGNSIRLLEIYGAFQPTDDMDADEGFRHGAIRAINELTTRLDRAQAEKAEIIGVLEGFPYDPITIVGSATWWRTQGGPLLDKLKPPPEEER